MAALAAPDELVARAEAEKPMVVFADLEGAEEPVTLAVERLRARAATSHLPVIGFRREMDDAAQASFIERGFTLTVNEAAILSHLPQLLDRALDVT